MKNLHLPHPEDSILTGDLSVLDWFIEPGNLSVKIDGAPAIVWGRNPATGNFFVGTKSVFNKKLIKINETHCDIDRNHSGRVADILHACFDYLPRTNRIIQGDFIGYGGSDTFHPNTITYKFFEEVEQKIIIAPHTAYTAEYDLRDAIAEPDTHFWVDTDEVKFVKPDAWIAHNQESFADVKEVCDFARQMSTLVNFVSNKEAAKITKQLNDCIREGREINSKEFDCDYLLIEFWLLIKSIKEDCLFLCRNSGPEAYIGYDRIDAEGYVMTNEFGMFKLVNREVFSRSNFIMEKAW
jgi:hypothetical protein